MSELRSTEWSTDTGGRWSPSGEGHLLGAGSGLVGVGLGVDLGVGVGLGVDLEAGVVL